MSESNSPADRLIARGQEAYARGDYAAAVAELREAARRAPQFADVHHLLGVCLALIGRPDEALEAFDRAVEINPRYVEALLNRAITLQEVGRYEEAHASFEAASEADVEEAVGRYPSVLATQLAHGHARLAELYRQAGATDEVVTHLRRAVELRPRFGDIRNQLARALIDSGNAAAAVAELDRILRDNPDFVAARINLGLAWYRSGDADAARREWRRCLEQRPGDMQVLGYLRMLDGPAEERDSPAPEPNETRPGAPGYDDR